MTAGSADYVNPVVPRCVHGCILLGCRADDCPEQDAYIADLNGRVDLWYERQQQQARETVRHLLGLDP